MGSAPSARGMYWAGPREFRLEVARCDVGPVRAPVDGTDRPETAVPVAKATPSTRRPLRTWTTLSSGSNPRSGRTGTWREITIGNVRGRYPRRCSPTSKCVCRSPRAPFTEASIGSTKICGVKSAGFRRFNVPTPCTSVRSLVRRSATAPTDPADLGASPFPRSAPHPQGRVQPVRQTETLSLPWATDATPPPHTGAPDEPQRNTRGQEREPREDAREIPRPRRVP